MRTYTKAAVEAHGLITSKGIDPVIAWETAIASAIESVSSRKKGCPKVTFLGLAYAGYLKDIDADASAKLNGILRERAISAANALLAQPGMSKKDLTVMLGYAYKQGSYDIVIHLAGMGILQRP
ncbi:hypothetical protein D8682_24665 [Buttiauxella sp. 3AFRM03]|uniref:DUF6979 family protein n=1 Tax=Buttiauxella sp. 3AFRM03 TaxID=2479367 RepID=UPI000EF8457E|nr:hypothetical protein [Buttiauxella sp. 3AFRM03]AYN29886.1 hypothetical protein D8682_24665 [Buttiauxella sp. 3AFRM03]